MMLFTFGLHCLSSYFCCLALHVVVVVVIVDVIILSCVKSWNETLLLWPLLSCVIQQKKKKKKKKKKKNNIAGTYIFAKVWFFVLKSDGSFIGHVISVYQIVEFVWDIGSKIGWKKERIAMKNKLKICQRNAAPHKSGLMKESLVKLVS